ncbi:MAG: DUF1800 domain-containing protein [Planctomycetaceae bacterium]
MTQQMMIEIDPQRAWEPFTPSSQNPWDLRAAAHLFRRAGFGATFNELTEAVRLSPADVVQQMLSTAEPAVFVQQMQSLASAALATGNVRQLSAWWAYRMLSTPVQLIEKLTLFWHGHFATSAEKVQDGELMLHQNQLLRESATGSFSFIVQEIARDPAMLLYLDSATNRKAHPNENFAREIMELFCLGEGNYTENDIRELARCFTGWEVRRGKFRVNQYQHDNGSKTVLGETGDFSGEDGVRIVVSQPGAAEFIVSKLIRFFLFDEPAASPELIAPLARLMRDSDMQIAPVVRTMLCSQLFFSSHSRARKIRSPVELAIGFLRSMQASVNTFELADQIEILGQGLLYPPSVKGWDGGRTWINSSTLLGRSNLIRDLLEDEKTRFDRRPVNEYLLSIGAGTSGQLLEHLEILLFAVPLPDGARQRVINLIDAAGDRRRNLIEGIHALCTLPEFQLA